MDALRFIEEINRMCQSYPDCNDCPLGEKNCDLLRLCTDDEIKVTLSIVEKWSKEHQHKTRQSMFMEQYPEAELTKDGVISICPIAVSAAYRNKTGGCASPTRPRCEVCLREFWMQEVEDGSAD